MRGSDSDQMVAMQGWPSGETRPGEEGHWRGAPGAREGALSLVGCAG